MLGMRGCRLVWLVPEVTDQVRAIFEAACEVQGEGGSVLHEVMIPLVSEPEEFRIRRPDSANRQTGEAGIRRELIICRHDDECRVPPAPPAGCRTNPVTPIFLVRHERFEQNDYGLSRDDSGKSMPL